MSKLLELADRVEALSGPDREVDCLIADAVLGPVRKPYVRGHCEKYTASLDAAMSLVPDGCTWGLTTSQRQGTLAEVYREDANGLTYGRQPSGRAALPAPALCAAALRARASQEAITA